MSLRGTDEHIQQRGSKEEQEQEMGKQRIDGWNRILAWIALCLAILPSLARAGIEIDEGT